MSDYWQNWSGNFKVSENLKLYRPTDVDELREAIADARSAGRTIRVAGTGHGWAELIANRGKKLAIIKLDQWKREIEIDLDDNTARIPVGLTVKQVEKVLDKAGLQLNSPPVYVKMSIGGLIGTASHGTGTDDTETMSDHLVGFKMMLADGRIIEIDKDRPLDDAQQELLRAVRCSMGVLGVVYEVTLKCTPSYWVKEDDLLLPVQEGIDRFKEFYEHHDFVETFWMPFNEKIWIKRYDRHERVHIGPLRWAGRKIKSGTMRVFQSTVYAWVLKAMCRWPDLSLPALRLFGSLLPTAHAIVPATEAIHFQRAMPNVVASAWIVRLDDIDELWRFIMSRMNDWCMRSKFPVNVMVESRFIKRSAERRGNKLVPSVLLSPAVFDDTAYVEVVSFHATPDWQQFYEELETGIIENFPEARPHWGKWFSRGKYLQQRYDENEPTRPRLDPDGEEIRQDHYRMSRFMLIKQQLDPDGVMCNEFLKDEVFSGEVSEKVPAKYKGVEYESN